MHTVGLSGRSGVKGRKEIRRNSDTGDKSSCTRVSSAGKADVYFNGCRSPVPSDIVDERAANLVDRHAQHVIVGGIIEDVFIFLFFQHRAPAY